MASNSEIRQLQRQQMQESGARAQGAMQRPTGRGRGDGFEPARTSPGRVSPAGSAPYRPGPPSNAEEMGGHLDDGGPPIQIGPQSDAGSFGGAMSGAMGDAHQLVKMVRQDRLARAAAQRTPSFGDMAQMTRDEDVQDQAAMAQQPAAPQGPQGPSPEEQAAQVAQIQRTLKFMVDTRSGHIQPVLPGEANPNPGPHDIIMGFGDDPKTPDIIAKGKRVTSQSIARLGDPKRGIQPSLKPGYKLPEQYAHVGEALGVPVAGEKQA